MAYSVLFVTLLALGSLSVALGHTNVLCVHDAVIQCSRGTTIGQQFVNFTEASEGVRGSCWRVNHIAECLDAAIARCNPSGDEDGKVLNQVLTAEVETFREMHDVFCIGCTVDAIDKCAQRLQVVKRVYYKDADDLINNITAELCPKAQQIITCGEHILGVCDSSKTTEIEAINLDIQNLHNSVRSTCGALESPEVGCTSSAVSECSSRVGNSVQDVLKSVSDSSCMTAKQVLTCAERARDTCQSSEGVARTAIKAALVVPQRAYDIACGGATGLVSSSLVALVLVAAALTMRD